MLKGYFILSTATSFLSRVSGPSSKYLLLSRRILFSWPSLKYSKPPSFSTSYFTRIYLNLTSHRSLIWVYDISPYLFDVGISYLFTMLIKKWFSVRIKIVIRLQKDFKMFQQAFIVPIRSKVNLIPWTIRHHLIHLFFIWRRGVSNI